MEKSGDQSLDQSDNQLIRIIEYAYFRARISNSLLRCVRHGASYTNFSTTKGVLEWCSGESIDASIFGSNLSNQSLGQSHNLS